MSFYEELTDPQQFACRVIADHARSTAFAIADGILPGNEGRNYVLRKIMRRAIYHGREHLGLTDPFFYKVCDFVVEKMHGAFPELETQRDIIQRVVKREEEKYGSTIVAGSGKLLFILGDPTLPTLRDVAENPTEFPDEAERLAEITGKFAEIGSQLKTSVDDLVLRIQERFNVQFKELVKLNDTYGLPRDLIRVGLSERGLEVDEEVFDEAFDNEVERLQQQSGIGKTERKSQPSPIYAEILEKVGSNIFHGYDTTHLTDAKIVAIIDGDKQIDSLGAGAQGSVVLDQTPFYAESGGQVGDVGKLIGNDVSATVADTYSPVSGLIIHKVTVDKGSIKIGDTVTATVDAEKRDATRRNHTATHLVHAALREVLGTHVKQGGSVVAPNVLRFDFTHYQPMTAAEITEVEDLVNREILKNEPVNTDIMSIEQAMAGGAMALFGEKYGADVRVLSVGDGVFSKELCGGTHVRATGDIGSFKIISDEAIASGVRRIRAITGYDAFERFRDDEKLIDASLGALNTQRDNLPNAISRLQEELKKTRKEMDELKLKIALGGQSAVGSGPASDDEATREIGGVKVLGKVVEGLDSNGTRQLSDTLLARLKSGVVIIGRVDEGKVGLIVRVSDDLTGKVKAGDIIREIAPIVGGRGGGKPDMAEGGGTEPAKLSEAIDAAYGVIEKMLA